MPPGAGRATRFIRPRPRKGLRIPRLPIRWIRNKFTRRALPGATAALLLGKKGGRRRGCSDHQRRAGSQQLPGRALLNDLAICAADDNPPRNVWFARQPEICAAGGTKMALRWRYPPTMLKVRPDNHDRLCNPRRGSYERRSPLIDRDRWRPQGTLSSRAHLNSTITAGSDSLHRGYRAEPPYACLQGRHRFSPIIYARTQVFLCRVRTAGRPRASTLRRLNSRPFGL